MSFEIVQLPNLKNARKISTFLNYRTSEINWRILFFWRGVNYDIEHCIFLAICLPNLQLNIGKKYIKTAKIIDESLILAIVLRNYSTKPIYVTAMMDTLNVH